MDPGRRPQNMMTPQATADLSSNGHRSSCLWLIIFSYEIKNWNGLEEEVLLYHGSLWHELQLTICASFSIWSRLIVKTSWGTLHSTNFSLREIKSLYFSLLWATDLTNKDVVVAVFVVVIVIVIVIGIFFGTRFHGQHFVPQAHTGRHIPVPGTGISYR